MEAPAARAKAGPGGAAPTRAAGLAPTGPAVRRTTDRAAGILSRPAALRAGRRLYDTERRGEGARRAAGARVAARDSRSETDKGGRPVSWRVCPRVRVVSGSEWRDPSPSRARVAPSRTRVAPSRARVAPSRARVAPSRARVAPSRARVASPRLGGPAGVAELNLQILDQRAINKK